MTQASGAFNNIRNAASVRRAVDEFDSVGRNAFLAKYGFGRARRYFLVIGERLYDSKAIVGAAYGYEFPAQGPLRASEFHGGERTIQPKLEELGFEVRVLPALPNREREVDT